MATRRFIQSRIFYWYNEAKDAVRRGALDKKRVNRALGLAQSKNFSEKIAEYGTNYHQCNCPDNIHTTPFCKHRLAFIIRYRVYQDVKLRFEEEVFSEQSKS